MSKRERGRRSRHYTIVNGKQDKIKVVFTCKQTNCLKDYYKMSDKKLRKSKTRQWKCVKETVFRYIGEVEYVDMTD